MTLTSASPAPAVQPPEDLQAALSGLVAAEGGRWFPELGSGPLDLRFVGGTARARCFLYRWEIADGRLARQVMVKVRHSRPELRRATEFEDRPILAPVRIMSDEDAARREYEGLRLIADALRGQDPARFGVLAPLALMPGYAALVTDVVQEPTLRTQLVASSRLRPGRRSPLGTVSWENAGAWLRIFHAQPTSLELAPVGDTPDQVGALLNRFGGFLRDRLGARPVLDEVSRSGEDVARAGLPSPLPLGTAHGDFTATNIFTAADGCVTVFDPLPVWRIPVYQDLATLLVGARVHPLQAATRGLAFPRADLRGYEAAALRGYFGDEPPPERALAVVELLVLLDRWAAMVSQRTPRGRLRAQVRDARIRIASAHYEAEAMRLWTRAADGPAAGSAASGP